jgi:hypothetical protein
MSVAALVEDGDVAITLLHVIDAGFAPHEPGLFTVLSDDEAETYDEQMLHAVGNALAIISEYRGIASSLIVRGGPRLCGHKTRLGSPSCRRDRYGHAKTKCAYASDTR